MKQVVDSFGVAIHGLFRDDSGALVFDSPEQFNKLKTSASAFQTLNNEVETLKQQIAAILEHLNNG